MTSRASRLEFPRDVAGFRESDVAMSVGASMVEWAHRPGLSYIDLLEAARSMAELTIRSEVAIVFITVTLDATPPSNWETKIQRCWCNPFPLGNA
jgi:hypothetical protein